MLPPGLKKLAYLGLKQIKNPDFYHHLRWFADNEYLPFAQLQPMQEVLLTRLLKEASQYVPAYSQRLAEAGVVNNGGQVELANFTRISPLTRQDLVMNRQAFVHADGVRRGLYFTKTGGSTATPLQIGHDRHYREWCLASNFFFNRWGGLDIGTPYFFLWPAYRDLHNQLHHWKDRFVIGYLQGRRILNCRVTSPELYEAFVKILNRQTDCRFMVGYASVMDELANFCLEHGYSIEKPFKAVFTTADSLTHRMRQNIESVFQCPVFNRYGCRDAGDIASECEYQVGFHINPLYTLVEVADETGTPLPYGEVGQLLITSLHNAAMPLIRYALGDEGMLNAPSRCKCGREWPTLTSITGRISEKLMLPDQRRFGGAFLHTAFDHLPRLKRYQIQQLGPTRLNILLRSPVPNYVETYAPDLNEVSRRLRVWTGVELEITYEQRDLFDKTPMGKELIVVHKFHQPTASGASLQASTTVPAHATAVTKHEHSIRR